jgi:hypothetical protein
MARTQNDLHRADQKRFEALCLLENNLLAYAVQLPSTPPYGAKAPEPWKIHEILGAYALALLDIEVDLDSAIPAVEIVNSVYRQISDACQVVLTSLPIVRGLPNSAPFRDYLVKVLMDHQISLQPNKNQAPDQKIRSGADIQSSAPNDNAKAELPGPAIWDGLVIFVPNDLEAQIVFPGCPPRTVGFEDMGFADGRGKNGKKPNKLWDLLLAFAKAKGRIENPSQAGLPEWKTVEQRVWALNRTLKRFFEAPSRPIHFINGGYESTFKIKVNPLSII